MDEYRALARQYKAVPIGSILSDFAQEGGPTTYRDDQRLKIAGVVTASKTKTTRNNTLMAYVTVEDDTGAMEMLVFSRVLGECGPWLKENMPVLAEGRISVRDEKAPQLMCDRIRQLTETGTDGAAGIEQGKKLYIKISGLGDPRWEKIKRILVMFPGEDQMKIRCSDTGKLLGTPCVVHRALVRELTELLGAENVVVKS